MPHNATLSVAVIAAECATFISADHIPVDSAECSTVDATHVTTEFCAQFAAVGPAISCAFLAAQRETLETTDIQPQCAAICATECASINAAHIAP